MKVHSSFKSRALALVILVPSIIQCVDKPADAIVMRAKITHLLEQTVRNGNRKELFSTLEHEFPLQNTNPHTKQLIQTTLIEQAKLLRAQKIAQLADTLSKSRIWAGVKAGVFGWIALAQILAVPQLANNNVLTNEAVLFNYMEVLFAGHRPAQPTMTALVNLAALYWGGKWAYENAHFAYYGNSTLIAEIKFLDEIINTANKTPTVLVVSNPPDSAVYNF